MASASSGSNWTVESQVPATEVGPDGKPQTGMKVNFVTSKGVHAYVFVAWPDYTPEKVKAAIGARYAALDAVHSLNG